MDIRILKYRLLLFVVCIISTIYSCRKPQKCVREYEFNFPATITPVLDSFSIGDTIWYEVEFNNFIEDEITGEQVDITNLDLTHFEFYIERFDTIHLTYIGNNFIYFATEGIFEQTSWGGRLYLDGSINKTFKMFFIPHERGGYAISGVLPFLYSDEELEVYLDNPCIASVFKRSRLMPNNDHIDFSVYDGRYTLIQTQTGVDSFFWDKIEDPQGEGSYVFWVD